MLTESERRKLVEEFLSGAMDSEALRTFTDMLKHDLQLRYELERESGVDALLHSAGSSSFTDKRFENALDSVMKEPLLISTNKTNFRMHWVQLYALAASVLLAIAGVYISSLHKNKAVQGQISANDYISIASATCHNAKSIYHLFDSSLFLSEEGSKFRVLHEEDSSINVVLSQGNVCFEMSDSDPHTITIATPHSAIVLSKRTITRVVVTELETEIAVLEGNAEVIHRYHREQPQELATGGTIFAGFDAVQMAQNIAPEVCESRTNMFKAYILWVQKQARG